MRCRGGLVQCQWIASEHAGEHHRAREGADALDVRVALGRVDYLNDELTDWVPYKWGLPNVIVDELEYRLPRQEDLGRDVRPLAGGCRRSSGRRRLDLTGLAREPGLDRLHGPVPGRAVRLHEDDDLVVASDLAICVSFRRPRSRFRRRHLIHVGCSSSEPASLSDQSGRQG